METRKPTTRKSNIAGKKDESKKESGSAPKVPTAVIGLVMIVLTNYQAEVKKLFELVLRTAA
jgi:hypothetical protein